MNNRNYESNQYRMPGHSHIVSTPPSSAPHPHTNPNRAQPHYYQNTNVQVAQHLSREPIIVHDHDVLSGRGVNIAHHAGNERFRTLITTYHDESYCTSYSASEKRAVATEIIVHIHALDPPGRFLKRLGKGQISRGLNGPWQALSDKESVKKTCQALRDCNRADRSGYADGVSVPLDVVVMAQKVSETGLTTKQRATVAAANAATEAAHAAQKAANESLKRRRPETLAHIDTTSSGQMDAHAIGTTHNLTVVANSHASPHSHTLSPSHHVHSPTHHVPQSTSPSMSVGSATALHGFPHPNMPSQAIIPQNMHNHNHSIAPAQYMNQIAVAQQQHQHQHPHPHPQQPYHTFPNIINHPYTPPMHRQGDMPMPTILSSNNAMALNHHNRHYTTSGIALSSGSSHEYNSSPIKKQRSTDDTEPSTVSGSSTTSTPMDGCNVSTIPYPLAPVPYHGPTAGTSNISGFLSSSAPVGGQDTDIGDAGGAGGVGLFRIKENEIDPDTSGSKHTWEAGVGGGAESDGDQYCGSLHSF